MSAKDVAAKNFESHLKNNVYPGRGIVVGKLPTGNFAIVYFIMGRSVNSRNRRFKFDGDRLWTEPVDESKVSDPSLIIYDAMLATNNVHLVSNGDQTKTIYDFYQQGDCFTKALRTREREPDAPNYTPRISAMIDFSGNTPKIYMSVLSANQVDPAFTDNSMFTPALPGNGNGYCLTTYMGDGDPLPSFNTMPLLMPLEGTVDEVLDTYWNALNSENRVSLGVKEIDADGNLVKIVVKNCHDGD
ncbi:MAG: inosine monophosphate cyclohydrolase [Deltaproteobacteria bacterium]|nr:inosine monophosphate cyclohydrolase [Deltaproteobacteria bacterium]MBN2673093.1 inosine monophosphate cyclohydrolase [Deltaproteobacteria bacterium]